ncbi:MAG: hypothetical protein ACRDZX_02065 [Acidimicrobiales bacterium]
MPLVALEPPGRDLVAEVARRRNAELAVIVARLPAKERRAVTAALWAFSRAAGEVPAQEWSLGWRLDART